MDSSTALGAQTDALQQTVSQERAAMQPAADKFNQVASQPRPSVPEQKSAPEEPKAEQFGVDAQNYVIAMSALSAVAGAFSRQHATTALNAFSGAVKGYKEGNQSAFDNASKEWEMANKKTLENNKMLLDKYESIMNERNLTEQEQMQKIQMTAFQYKDQMMADAKGVDVAAKILEIREQAAGRLEMAKARVQEHKEMVDALLQNKKEQEEAAYEKAKSDPRWQGLADAYAKTGNSTPLVKGFGKDAQQSAALIQKLAFERHPKLDLSKVQIDFSRKKTESTTLGRQEIQTKLASNILDSSIPSLINIAKKYSLGPSTDLNGVYNFLMSHGSAEDKSNFSTQLRAVTTDYSQFISRGRPTIHSDQEALKILSDNMGINSLEGFRTAVKTESKNVKSGIKETEGDITDDPPEGSSSGKQDFSHLWGQ